MEQKHGLALNETFCNTQIFVLHLEARLRTFARQNSAKQWARFALKCGLLLTDAKLWATINDQMKERVGHLGHAVKQEYESRSDAFDDVRRSLRHQNDWITPVLGFVGGVGLGVGLGMLFAPASGEEVRSVLHDKVWKVRNKVGDVAGGGALFRSTKATGTDGD